MGYLVGLPARINNRLSNSIHSIIPSAFFLLLLLLTLCIKTTSGVTPQQQKCLICSPDIVVPTDTNQCGAVVNFPIPNTNSCRTGVTLSFSQQPGSFFPTGSTIVTISAFSGSTLIDQCSFTINVVDREAPKIACPSDIVATLSPGQATAVINFPNPVITDNCGLSRFTFSPASGFAFPIGNTTVTLTAFDQAGNRSSCTFNVLVIDQEPPKLTCPNDLSVKALPGDCFATVTFPPVTVSDNSNFTSIIYTPPSGSRLPIGKTLVQVTARDFSGNVANCSFNVTVNSADPLRINCPGDITVTANNGQCGAIVNYPIPTINNACAGSKVSSSPSTGSFFPLGKTLVTVTASDATGAKATCTFNVLVNSAQPPQISCPLDITTSTVNEDCTAKVDYPPITIVNDCLGSTIDYSIPSGSIFKIGQTPVTVTATDASGNKSSCTFNVKVTSSPILVLKLEDEALALNFGPLNARRKPKKLPPFRMFTMENRGCVPLQAAFASVLRTGNDVIRQRITNPDDSQLFTIQADQPDRTGQKIAIGSMISLMPKEKRTFFILFQPLIPPVNTGTGALKAQDVLPSIVTSQVTIAQSTDMPVTIPLIGRLSLEVNLIDPINPSRTPVALFTRNGDEFTTEFSVYDANLDVNKAVFQFFNSSGQPVDQPITVDLSQALQQSALLRGQSFTIVQKFTGASTHPDYNSVQVTVFDSTSNATIKSGGITPSAAVNTTLIDPLSGIKENKLVLPALNLTLFK